MSKLLISIPDKLANQFKAMVPARKRSHFLVYLIKKAVEKQEDALYACAKSVEADESLNQDMQSWDITLEDGLDSQNWDPEKHD
jgi:hypothetical protein